MEANPARPRRVESRGSSMLGETSVGCVGSRRSRRDSDRSTATATATEIE